MFDFNLYSLDDFSSLEEVFFNFNKNCDIVLLNLGTKKCCYDSFAVDVGDKLKKLKFFVYGSSKREINGKNFLKTIEFIEKKHKNCKIIIIDSVFISSKNKPILIYREGKTRVSFLNSTKFFGDASLLYNSFSEQNEKMARLTMLLIQKMFKKFEEKMKK